MFMQVDEFDVLMLIGWLPSCGGSPKLTLMHDRYMSALNLEVLQILYLDYRLDSTPRS